MDAADTIARRHGAQLTTDLDTVGGRVTVTAMSAAEARRLAAALAGAGYAVSTAPDCYEPATYWVYVAEA